MQRILESELRLGELVVWSQQPRLAAMALKSLPKFLFGVGGIAFGIWLASLAANGSTSSSRHEDPAFYRLPVGLFLLFAVIQLLSALWACCQAFRTVYAITNQRAVHIVVLGPRTVYSFVGQNLMNIHRVENRSGNGDIIFHREVRDGQGARRGLSHEVGFLGIARVREAEDALWVLFQKTRTG